MNFHLKDGLGVVFAAAKANRCQRKSWHHLCYLLHIAALQLTES